jgi:NADP-dependent 3-hydroxy acid dehydrogenase YdfG
MESLRGGWVLVTGASSGLGADHGTDVRVGACVGGVWGEVVNATRGT